MRHISENQQVIGRVSHHSMQNAGLWRPHYGAYSLDRTLRRLDDIGTRLSDADLSMALQRTEAFVRKVFNDYRTKDRLADGYGFVFAVPTRLARGYDLYQSEAAHFMPIVNFLDPYLRQVLVSELPPCVIDEYKHPSGAAHGAVMFVPLFIDMLRDIPNKLLLHYYVRKIIKDTALFSRDRLGATIMGLGATLPKVTRFGQHIRKYGVETTTGHGGTVYLLLKMYEQIVNSRAIDIHARPIGIIGAGSIGEAAAQLLLTRDPDITVSIHDKRAAVQADLVRALNLRYGRRVKGAKDNEELLNCSQIIISAVTSKIPIGDDVDLYGKVIIDDSQPASFYMEEVAAHGGTMVWVVGRDNSHDQFLTRRSGYTFGEEGLLNIGDVWGCEAEVGALWRTGSHELAITSHVTPDSALVVGHLMDACGIGVADFQQHGQPVSLGISR